MAVTDPAAIAFSNTQIRPIADSMSTSYWTAKKLLANWNSLGMSAKFPNDTTAVSDGAAQDGRNQITGAMVNNIVNRAQEIITDYEATSNAKLNTVLQVQVNGQSKF